MKGSTVLREPGPGRSHPSKGASSYKEFHIQGSLPRKGPTYEGSRSLKGTKIRVISGEQRQKPKPLGRSGCLFPCQGSETVRISVTLRLITCSHAHEGQVLCCIFDTFSILCTCLKISSLMATGKLSVSVGNETARNNPKACSVTFPASAYRLQVQA